MSERRERVGERTSVPGLLLDSKWGESVAVAPSAPRQECTAAERSRDDVNESSSAARTCRPRRDR